MKELSPPSSAHVSPPGGTPTAVTAGAEKTANGAGATRNGRGDEDADKRDEYEGRRS